MVRTPWNTPDIWRRKSFNLPEEALSELGDSPLLLRIHRDEDTEVFLNGEEVASMEGYTIG
jgi:hypothetical protein